MKIIATEQSRKVMDFVVDYANERGVNLPPPEDIEGSSTLDDLGFDSLDQAGMLTDIEREFDIDFADEVLEKKTTLDELLSIISQALASSEPAT